MRLNIERHLIIVALAGLSVAATARASHADTCVPTGYGGLTAAVVNPGTVSGTIDATGCDVGVYVDSGSTDVDGAEVFGAESFGIFANGDSSEVVVDIVDSWIHNIGDVPFNGNQRGVAIYYRSFLGSGSATGRVSGNTIELYQKGGIVVNGAGSKVQVKDNAVSGLGPVTFIAQNGIQIGYGADAVVQGNHVSGHAYSKDNSSWVSGGILEVWPKTPPARA